MRAFFLQQQIEQATQILAQSKKDQQDHIVNMQTNVSKTLEIGNLTVRINNPRHGTEVLVLDVVISETEGKHLVMEANLRIDPNGKSTLAMSKTYRVIEVGFLARILTELNAYAEYIFNNF